MKIHCYCNELYNRCSTLEIWAKIWAGLLKNERAFYIYFSGYQINKKNKILILTLEVNYGDTNSQKKHYTKELEETLDD